LADRIANLENSIERKHNMLDAYKKEHEDFKKQLYVQGHAENMWTHLDLLIKTL